MVSNSATPPSPDPRIGLRAGTTDSVMIDNQPRRIIRDKAAETAWNIRLISNTPPSERFNGVTNSDLAFIGNDVIQGNYNGYQVFDISNPRSPVLKTAYYCPASQSDVSVYRNLLFVSAEGQTGRHDCGGQGVPEAVSAIRVRGIRIFDISDITHPRYIKDVQTCRGSHTHTVLVPPNDPENVYVYVSGSAGVRPEAELSGCSDLSPENNPNSSQFRIEVIKVPVARLTSKDYAGERRRAIDSGRAQRWGAGVQPFEGAHTTHMTAADAMGNVVATTQTINNLFGAKFLIPGLGTVPNNYMNLYDPRPGHALSLAPGKRVTTSMSPMMALHHGKLVYALGLPGGKRIFPSALQALINLIDHGMSLQEAVEAPRVWTEGNALEVESAIPERVRADLAALGHEVVAVPTVAGGMNAIQFHADGSLTGAACWRADGTPIGLAGGLARAGVRFDLA